MGKYIHATCLAWAAPNGFCLILVIWIDLTLENLKWITIHHYVTSELPTQPTYLAFCLLFGLGAPELANLAFQLFFLLSSYLNWSLCLPGLRLSCWAPLILYLSNNLPRLNSLDRSLFFISTTSNLNLGTPRLSCLAFP